VILFRCFAWDLAGAGVEWGGPAWFPRRLQGDGRHDAPERYGCLYVSAEPVSTVVEELAALAGSELAAGDLVRRRLPLALATLRLPDNALVVDLDDPALLAAEALRPSDVATREREKTQAVAAALHERYPEAVGLRWWSTFEPAWANVTLFDRAAIMLKVTDVRELKLDDETVGEAARFLGLRVAA
jgi:RES domain